MSKIKDPLANTQYEENKQFEILTTV